ncbi:hypothetical protein [Arundinibacter roseus]|uniref:Glycine zipper-like domain-containing protein n=1 Tax=Arundinibacter roseus TaxID=2070510 RepID=A0A4V2X835_9BACT|nr:hypothetical protein [Arundinibacter roseus]TDB58235.1 hypothetical protein EZE20_23245 [Arundinibacter roseus]
MLILTAQTKDFSQQIKLKTMADTKKKNPGSGIAIGAALGLLFGLVYGKQSGNISQSIALGLAFGVAVGTIFDFARRG